MIRLARQYQPPYSKPSQPPGGGQFLKTALEVPLDVDQVISWVRDHRSHVRSIDDDTIEFEEAANPVGCSSSRARRKSAAEN